MPQSPTQCTLKHWKSEGYMCAVVEKWNPHVKIRQDLYGFIDVLAVGQGRTVAIQTTSRDHVSDRLKKIQGMADKVAPLQLAGWKIYVEGWHKQKNRWVCRREAVPILMVR